MGLQNMHRRVLLIWSMDLDLILVWIWIVISGFRIWLLFEIEILILLGV